MAENRAPNAAESSPAVSDLDSDQADRGAALATPATKKLKLEKPQAVNQAVHILVLLQRTS